MCVVVELPTLTDALTDALYSRLVATAKNVLARKQYMLAGAKDSCLTTAAHEAIAEYFVLGYERYRTKYDASRGKTYEQFLVLEFSFVLQRATYKQVGAKRLESTDDIGTPMIAARGCVDPEAIAIEAEEEGLSAERMAAIKALLPKLSQDQSWVLWNHARGVSYDEIAHSLRMSRSTVQGIHRGAVAAMRRLIEST